MLGQEDSLFYTDDNGKNVTPMEKVAGNEEESSPQKRSSMSQDGDTGEQKVSAKFLLSNAHAGSVIGKGGVTISEFQAQSGARIQLSPSREFFPGTADRILLLTGTVNAILTALHLILSKLLAEEPAGLEGQAAPPSALMAVQAGTSTVVKLVVPSAVCGGIIGKAGATIRSYQEDSGAHIKLSSQMVPGVHERVITITGTLEQQLRAVALIITKMAEDPNFPMHSSINLSYPQSGGGVAQGGARAQGGPSMQQYGGAIALAPSVPRGMPVAQMHTGPTTTVTVAVPDEHIGAVVGKGGKYISEMQQVSGVRIKISERNDYVPGTRNRKVTLTGTLEAVQIAQFLISQKVQQSAAEMQSMPPTR